MVEIRQADGVADISAAGELFREYEAWLGMDLCFQGFEDELASLPGKYAPPSGRLLLAFVDSEPAGCIAMRGLGDGICEMKRLYLRENVRGHGLGNQLIETLINEAKAAGYTTMLLDTYPPKMRKAVGLYESHGFYAIDAYYENPHDGVLYMEARL